MGMGSTTVEPHVATPQQAVVPRPRATRAQQIAGALARLRPLHAPTEQERDRARARLMAYAEILQR